MSPARSGKPAPLTETTPEEQSPEIAEVYPELTHLLDQLDTEIELLIAGVESLDGQMWMDHATNIQKINLQIRGVRLQPVS